MRKWHMIRKCDRLTEGPTDQLTLQGVVSLVDSKGKLGRIHGKTVGDGWAGAAMQKSLAIHVTDRYTD